MIKTLRAVEENKDNGKVEIYSQRVRAGKRTYFFDVKATRSNDYYLTITESKKRFEEDGRFRFEKHKLFLYKEDFEKFRTAFLEALDFAYDELEKIDALPRDYFDSEDEGDDEEYDSDDSDSDSDDD